MKRSHEALRARDRGRSALARPHPSTPDLSASDAACTAWLTRHHATLEPPSPKRPYFTVFLSGRFFTAGPTRHAAITKAMRTRIPGPPT